MIDQIIHEDLCDIYNRDIDWESFRNSTILITGAYGMLASYLMYMLIFLNEEKKMGIHIIAMIRSSEKFVARFGEYSQADYITLVTDPVIEPIRIDRKVDYIIHAASLASPQYYDICPVDVLSPNVLGTYYLLEFAKERSIKKFLLFSTGDVYGKIRGTDFVTESDMGVIDPIDIHSCYSESKRMAETICMSFMHQYNIPIAIARIWHTYGPTMDIYNDPRVFASFMKNVINGQDIEIKSDGTGRRTFCYIADTIAGLFVILTKGEVGEAYNICNTDQFVSIRELAEQLASLRQDVSINTIWKQRSEEEHYTENTAIGQIAPSNEKIKRLGWKPQYDIKNGFRKTLYYYGTKNEKS